MKALLLVTLMIKMSVMMIIIDTSALWHIYLGSYAHP